MAKAKGAPKQTNGNGRYKLPPAPTKYTPDMPARVVELMADGLSIYEVARDLGVTKMTLYAYKDKYPEMAAALRDGADLSRAWWETRGRLALHDKTFNTAVWFINMKNRFGWKDNPDDLDEDAGDAPEVVQV